MEMAVSMKEINPGPLVSRKPERQAGSIDACFPA